MTTDQQQSTSLYSTDALCSEFGVIRLENWPEGLVLWVGGSIRWRSWRDADFVATRLPERKAAADEINAIMKATNDDQ